MYSQKYINRLVRQQGASFCWRTRLIWERTGLQLRSRLRWSFKSVICFPVPFHGSFSVSSKWTVCFVNTVNSQCSRHYQPLSISLEMSTIAKFFAVDIFVSSEQFSSSLYTFLTIVSLVDNVNSCQIVVVVIFVSVLGEQPLLLLLSLQSGTSRPWRE